MEGWMSTIGWFLVLCFCSTVGSHISRHSPKDVISVTFLITVNDTWYPDEYGTTCLQTVKTPPLKPNGKWNESQSIQVGKCDYGALIYEVNESVFNEGGQKKTQASIYLTFFSHVIEDASHPACRIQWNYSYLEPTTVDPRESLLPGCWLADSREGYHMTYYWFHILDWVLG